MAQNLRGQKKWDDLFSETLLTQNLLEQKRKKQKRNEGAIKTSAKANVTGAILKPMHPVESLILSEVSLIWRDMVFEGCK